MRATAIPADVLDVLRASRVDGTTLFLPPTQLERSLYEKVNKVLVALGGKWNRGAKGHVFKTDPRPLWGAAVESGAYTDRKKALQFFETPAEIARGMVERAEIKKTDRILEPSAGHGAIIAQLPQNHPGSYITAVEVDGQNCEVLAGRFPTINVVAGDFLELARLGGAYSVVLMNPPFANGQDIDHIRRAWGLLMSGGRLVAICADNKGYRQDRKHRDFAAWLEEICADQERIPAGTFRESGTDVATRMIWARK